MARKDGWRRAVWVLSVSLLVPATSFAGPFLGDWGWCWKPARDCPRSAYSPLHYWASSLYRAKALVHPGNVDEYPPGPATPIAPSYEINSYKCRAIPPMPTSPYADPAGYYYGR